MIKKLSGHAKLRIGLQLTGIVGFSIALILLWTILPYNNFLLYITTLTSFLLVLYALGILSIVFEEKFPIKENIELMKFKVDKYKAWELLFLGIGLPTIVDACIKGILNNMLQSVFALACILIGLFIGMHVELRENAIERKLMKKR